MEVENWGNYVRYSAPDALLVHCPTCGSHMSGGPLNEQWMCLFCDDRRLLKKQQLVTAISDHDAYCTTGMPGSLYGPCPQCGSNRAIHGDPDGALMCRNCEYYERQYSSEWYAYAAWYLDKDYVVTINE